MRNNPRCWMRCADCGHRQMERRSSVGRRTRPRCTRCGGMLEISEAARNDLVRGMDRRRLIREQRENEVAA